MAKHKNQSKSDAIILIICVCLFFGGIAWSAYQSPTVRLDHFASLATVLGSLATAATLIWLVLERDQLQKEKIKTEMRKQAAGVSTWLSTRTSGDRLHLTQQIIVLNNNSDSPIYNLVVSIVDARNKDAKGEETPDEFRRIIDASPPGQAYCFAPVGYSGMGFHPSVEVAFSDANGNHWVRRGNGRLEPLPNDPFMQYEIAQPPTYEPLHRL
jgi:hypothetical protein